MAPVRLRAPVPAGLRPRTVATLHAILRLVVGRRRPDLLPRRLQPPLVAAQGHIWDHPGLDLRLTAMGAHLSPEFRATADDIEGATDDAVRNALTQMGRHHLTPIETARLRVLAMGEEPLLRPGVLSP